MVQRYLDRLVAVAALAAVMGCLTPLSKADAQGTTDAAAKKKVEQFLGAGLPGKATVHFVDLNGDGVPEALVISDDPQDCGTHGCAASVLDLRGPAAKEIGGFIAFDLQPLSSQTRGSRDIFHVRERKQQTGLFASMVEFTSRAGEIRRPRHHPSEPSPAEGPVPHHHRKRECVEFCSGVQGRFRGQQGIACIWYSPPRSRRFRSRRRSLHDATQTPLRNRRQPHRVAAKPLSRRCQTKSPQCVSPW